MAIGRAQGIGERSHRGSGNGFTAEVESLALTYIRALSGSVNPSHRGIWLTGLCPAIASVSCARLTSAGQVGKKKK